MLGSFGSKVSSIRRPLVIVTDHRSKFCDDGLERRQIGLELDQHVGQHPNSALGYRAPISVRG
jgi:hypothetical protein